MLLVLKVGAVLMTPSIVTDAHVFLRPCDLAVLNDWLRLYDSDATKAVVKKWVTFYKQHRPILTSDIVHVRRPDMQSIDSFMHVNPFLAEKALAMVFNPTTRRIAQTLRLPLYYTGLSSTATVSEQGANSSVYQLARDYSIDVPVDLPANTLTWFLVQ